MSDAMSGSDGMPRWIAWASVWTTDANVLRLEEHEQGWCRFELNAQIPFVELE